METICAWCRCAMGPEAPEAVPTGISHGICSDCSRRLLQEIPINLLSYLNQLDIPLILVSQNITATFANQKASRVLGIHGQDLLQKSMGSILFCAHAQSPEGCGRTEHCSGCTIRRCLRITHETGAPFVDVPIRIQQFINQIPQEQHLNLSTVLVGDMVILRVDEVPSPEGA